jgi:hypothetical protein
MGFSPRETPISLTDGSENTASKDVWLDAFLHLKTRCS